jgi:hypothetical protein
MCSVRILERGFQLPNFAGESRVGVQRLEKLRDVDRAGTRALLGRRIE